MDGGLHPSLAGDLSEIFAWTVDFFGFRRETALKLSMKNYSLMINHLGTGKIYGAQFNWTGSQLTAIPFIQDGRETLL